MRESEKFQLALSASGMKRFAGAAHLEKTFSGWLRKKRPAQAEDSIGEWDRLFIRIYEGDAAGWIEDGRFVMMSKNYIQERKDLKAKIKSLQQKIEEQERRAENLKAVHSAGTQEQQPCERSPRAQRACGGPG